MQKIQLKNFPILYVKGEIPLGTWVIKINTASIRILAQKGITNAFIKANTSKTVKSFLTPAEMDMLYNMLKVLSEKITMRNKAIRTWHMSLSTKLNLIFEERTENGSQPVFVENLQELQQYLDTLGVSDIPLTVFVIPLDGQSKGQWIRFERGQHGYHCTHIGNEKVGNFTNDELTSIIQRNPVLQKLGSSICQRVA